LDVNERPHISYYDSTNGDLKYTYWTGTEWHKETVDSQGDVGECTSISLDSNDLPHISYRDDTNYDMKYAHFDGTK